jgi:hypothetical protein
MMLARCQTAGLLRGPMQAAKELFCSISASKDISVLAESSLGAYFSVKSYHMASLKAMGSSCCRKPRTRSHTARAPRARGVVPLGSTRRPRRVVSYIGRLMHAALARAAVRYKRYLIVSTEFGVWRVDGAILAYQEVLEDCKQRQ